MASASGIASGCQRTDARGGSRVTTALATPGTACNAAEALRTQFWQFNPASENSVASAGVADGDGARELSQPQDIAGIKPQPVRERTRRLNNRDPVQ
jgi:hypothetical protein